MANKPLSVVEALREAHLALLKDLAGLEDAARSSVGTDSAEMRSRLERARSHITEHFRFEEQNGYMDAVLDHEPNLARIVENLREEHRQLAQELEGLIERTMTGRHLEVAFRDQVRSWIEGVRRHEHRENSLVQDAFNVDFGAED
jgi:predicted  nucleic acid-binding Zn-ribbon protein